MKHFFESIFGQQTAQNETKIFFVETALIKSKEENKGGVITKIELEEGAKFNEIKLNEKPKIVSMKRGISKVIQDLELNYDNPGTILHILQDIITRKKKVSIVHIDAMKNAFLYGENNGLSVTELTESTILLEGEEADSFFKISKSLAEKLSS